MKNYRINSFIIFFIIILILSSGYYKYKTEINYSINNLVNRIQPCQRPITYSINALDERFHLSKEELIIQTEKAQKIWGSTLNKDLFKYSENGEIKINLIYDYRQKATDELSKIGVVIDGGKTNLNTLKAKHDSYLESYNKEIAKINQMIAKYDSNKAIYDNDLRNWNNGTRQSNSEFNSIEQKRLNLNNEIALINKEKVISNELVKMINSNVTSINKVVNNFNLNVKNYNSIGSSTGKIFDEGEYTRESSDININIYQFKNSNQLLRVLAHEFGHALGIEHQESPESIMYYLNENGNDKLTIEDKDALKKACKIN